jgi:hypothetical protein
MTREEEQRLEMRLDAIVDELGGDEDRALQMILRAATGFDPRGPDECLVMLVREYIAINKQIFGGVTI